MKAHKLLGIGLALSLTVGLSGVSADQDVGTLLDEVQSTLGEIEQTYEDAQTNNDQTTLDLIESKMGGIYSAIGKLVIDIGGIDGNILANITDTGDGVSVGGLVKSVAMELKAATNVNHIFLDAKNAEDKRQFYFFSNNDGNPELGIYNHRGSRNIALKGEDGAASWMRNGSLGIGTTAPEAKLHIANATNEALLIERTSGQSSIKAGAADGFLMLDSAGQQMRLNNYVSDNIILANGGGKIGIGTTTPTNVLTVKQGSDTDPVADSWGVYSSRRWKTAIQEIENAVEKVKKLRGVTYEWKANGQKDIGLIAEEVGEIFPEIVAYEANGVDAKSVDYARLVAVLIEAVKEQQNDIDTLKAEKAELEEELTAIKDRLDAIEANL